MLDDVKNQIEEFLQPFLHNMDIELIDLVVRPQSKLVIVEVLADRIKGRIAVDQCATINRFLLDQIDERQLIPGDYRVEVASPGLDRPLKTAKDFNRIVGAQARFHLKEKIAGKVEYSGIIEEVSDTQVCIKVKEEQICIPLTNIQKAVQLI